MTTTEHPFYIDGFSWLKVSLLQSGMPLLERNGHSDSLKIKSQTLLSRYETVYNLGVEDYETYHIVLFMVLVHNECLNIGQANPTTGHEILGIHKIKAGTV